MTHRRPRHSHLEAAATLSATVLLAACGSTDAARVDTQDEAAGGEPGIFSEEGKEADGTAVDADATPNKDKPPVVLPYEALFTIQHDQDSRRFVISRPVSITILSKAEWINPGACRGTPWYTITLLSDAGYEGDAKKFPINGEEHGVSWQNLSAGKYYALVSVRNPYLQRCTLRGTLHIRIT